jgi:GT2 family glycosyltransferase
MRKWTSINAAGHDTPLIEIVSATRGNAKSFWETSALGLTLTRLSKDGRVTSRIAVENSEGLPEIYNSRIETEDGAEILVFVHDDVWIDDFFLADRLSDGLARFDVIGVAGNRRRVPGQPSWAFRDRIDGSFVWDRPHLSGYIGHGERPFQGYASLLGPTPSRCELLDGLFLAARKSTLRERGVKFDTRFDFHFYDMDFCRGAAAAGLSMGTWPISLTHQSQGSLGSPHWLENYRRYLDKWEEPATHPAWALP